LIYYADQKYCPYGPRPADEIRLLSERVTRFLLARGCKAIVVACNTASAAALEHLRSTIPAVPFIGMEPAVKPAALRSQTGKVGVLATKGTLEGELFQHTRDTHARGVEVLVTYPTDWVARVERGDIDSPETEESVRRIVQPFLDAGADEIALGCTHYPFLSPLIGRVANGRAEIIDPSQAVARQAARVLSEHGLLNPGTTEGTRAYYTSGEPASFSRLLRKLIGEEQPAAAG
jgi:glutamate racemase